jgi:hypothetical protein
MEAVADQLRAAASTPSDCASWAAAGARRRRCSPTGTSHSRCCPGGAPPRPGLGLREQHRRAAARRAWASRWSRSRAGARRSSCRSGGYASFADVASRPWCGVVHSCWSSWTRRPGAAQRDSSRDSPRAVHGLRNDDPEGHHRARRSRGHRARGRPCRGPSGARAASSSAHR